MYSKRLQALAENLSLNQVLLVSNSADVSYLTGFEHLVPSERESFLLLTKKENRFFYSSFSPFVKPEGINAQPGIRLSLLVQILNEWQKKYSLSEFLFDEEDLRVKEYMSLKNENPKFALKPWVRQQIWELRLQKDSAEIQILKKAKKITAQVMQLALERLEVGISERELENFIRWELEKHGAQAEAFPTIVAFARNSALPHHQPGENKLKKEMAVLIDMGAKVDGYHGDMTRTVWFGDQPDPKFTQIEKIVKKAYAAAEKKLTRKKSDSKDSKDSKIFAKDLDNAARELITEAEYGQNFIHTTGHGVGLEIHEPPSLNWNNEQPILPGMVITIEPGIYLEGKFGYRHENMIFVEKTRPFLNATRPLLTRPFLNATKRSHF